MADGRELLSQELPSSSSPSSSSSSKSSASSSSSQAEILRSVSRGVDFRGRPLLTVAERTLRDLDVDLVNEKAVCTDDDEVGSEERSGSSSSAVWKSGTADTMSRRKLNWLSELMLAFR